MMKQGAPFEVMTGMRKIDIAACHSGCNIASRMTLSAHQNQVRNGAGWQPIISTPSTSNQAACRSVDVWYRQAGAISATAESTATQGWQTALRRKISCLLYIDDR
jgi:hypothetical protein